MLTSATSPPLSNGTQVQPPPLSARLLARNADATRIADPRQEQLPPEECLPSDIDLQPQMVPGNVSAPLLYFPGRGVSHDQCFLQRKDPDRARIWHRTCFR